MPQRYHKGPFAQWLEKRYIDMMRAENRRLTVAEFAQRLGFRTSVVNNWLNGARRPNAANIRRLAAVLGDEVYDVLGLPRPDPDLQIIIQGWGRLSVDHQRALREQYDLYATQP